MNILLTSVGRRSYLVNYFKEALNGEGLVHVANSTAISPAFKVADKYAVSPLIYDKQYIPFLLEYCKENRIDVLISLFDIDLPVLASNKQLFDAIGTRVIVSDSKVIDICNDKWKTYLFLRDNELNVPMTYLRLEDALADVQSQKIKFPLMVKPRWGMGSISIYEAENAEELKIFYDKAKRKIMDTYLKYESNQDPDECVLIQQKIEGQEYGLDIINDLDGKHINTIVKKKYAMRSGETDCAMVVDNPILKSAGEKLAKLLKHQSNLDVDMFLYNDEPYVLEMNARFGGGYPFSHNAGVNLPLAIIKWAKGNVVSKELLEAKCGIVAQKDIMIVDISNQVYSDIGSIYAMQQVDKREIYDFIKNEIEPYLSIPLEKKLTVANLSQYIDKIYEKADGFVYVIDGKVRGLIVGYINNRYTDDVYITMYGVAKGFRGNGIGKKMMDEFLSKVPKGCSVYTNVDRKNEVALSVYVKCGFAIVDEKDGRLTIRKN